MIYLNKILPVFLLPTGITLLLLVAALVWRRWILCGIGLAVLLCASLPPVSNAAVRWVEGHRTRLTVEEVAVADAIIVLGGAIIDPPGDNDVLEWGDAVDRYEGGLALFVAGKASRLIFTRGVLPWKADALPEGEVLAEWAIERGVPQASILLTSSVANTAEEAQAVAFLLSEQGIGEGTVLLVTSAFHMRRALLLFERANIKVVPYAVDFQTGEDAEFTILDLLPNAGSLAKSELALREFYGYLFYKMRP